jgi:hypothetical protein
LSSENKIDRFYREALSYIEKNRGKELNEIRRTSSPEYFQQLTVEDFLQEYIWTVYAAGFKVAILEAKFSDLGRAFGDFSLNAICRMTSIAQVLRVINHTKKAESVIEGAKMISKIGFSNLKRLLVEKGPAALMDLPYIGPVNKNQLARDIGLASLHKDDIWIQRLVGLSGSRSGEQMVNRLSQKFGEPPGIIDLILWRFCADAGWKIHGQQNIEKFFGTL